MMQGRGEAHGITKMRTIAAILAVLLAPSAHAVFKCVDEQGRTYIGETPPAACDHVPMFEMSPSGTVLRRIEPTPTPDQLKVRQEEAHKKQEAQKAALEQQRHDTALLNSFSSEKEFDYARDRNIEPLTGRIHSAQDRIKDIDARLAVVQKNIETWRAAKGPKGDAAELPATFAEEQQRLGQERQSLLRNIAANEKEIQEQRERFARDKKRWVELKSGTATMPVADRK
jgi:hypothetical protein